MHKANNLNIPLQCCKFQIFSMQNVELLLIINYKNMHGMSNIKIYVKY